MTTQTLSDKTRERVAQGERSLPKVQQLPKPMSPRARVANREWYPGLCTTCANESTCTFPRSADHPVLSCDEFVGAVEVKPRAVQNPRASERSAVANREWFPGLCMTCAKRETCTYPKPEGGVFRCDEFE